MIKWKPGRVNLACDALRKHIHGKKIALMMNTTAIDNAGRLLLDVIVREQWAEVAFFFGMEHGVRGNLYAGDGKLAAVDAKTGIRIVNLYEYPGLRPPVEWIEQVDAVVFCAQDVGVRHWTYTPWMMELIRSAAKANREVIILDRPNPIRGDIVEGAPAEPCYAGTHLLSGFEYPLRHGMTIGELALMFNGEKKIGANLTVLPMEGWTREQWYGETGLLWMPGSPNMPTSDTPLYFAATGLMQSATFSLGIGTTTPFQYVGDPEFDGERLVDALNRRELPGIFFVPKYYMAMTYRNLQKGNGRELTLCDGAFMVIHDRNVWRPVETQLHIMDALNQLFGSSVGFENDIAARPRMCTNRICDALRAGESLAPVIKEWQAGAERFCQARKPYLLYENS